MEQYGEAGLRTLCLAYRDLSLDTYESWNEKFIQAKSSLRDREKKLEEVRRLDKWSIYAYNHIGGGNFDPSTYEWVNKKIAKRGMGLMGESHPKSI